MLEFYFENQITMKRLRDGPAGRFIDGFSGCLKSTGYSWWTARVFLRAADHIGRYAEAQGRDMCDIDWGTLTSFETHLPICSCPGSSRCKTVDVVRGAKHFIEHLRENNILKIPSVDDVKKIAAPVVLDFQFWLRKHRGLSESTVGHYSQAASQFLTDHGEDPSRYDAKTLREFVLSRAEIQGKGATKTLISGLRMFMRYMASQGLCRPGLDQAIPAVACWRLTTIPRSLESQDVKRILDACDATSPMGRRDRAIILLLARLGLRVGDVAGLRLDDIDWRDASILVSGKSRRQARLPLSQEVGDAIVEYLKCRPGSDAREIFLRSVAPFRPFGSGGSASQVVTRAMRRAGVSASCYGAHALRHTAACEMLRQGVSLYEIGAVLRHRSVAMTAHYAKVDMALLKQVVQPWPEVH